MRGDAHAITRPADRAFQHVGSAELLAHLLRGHRLVAKREHLRARKNLQLRDLRNLRDDVFGNPVAKIFVLFRAALIFEVQHRDGFLPRRARNRLRSGTRAAFFRSGPSARFHIAPQPFQVRAKLRGGLVAQIGILLQRLA